MSVRAAIYTRISQDREGGGLGVQRQRVDCAALCKRNGWAVVADLSDNDISAFSGKRRPGYEKLLSLMEAGDVDAVVAWHNDRLHRSTVELEHYITVSERQTISTHTVQAGLLDLATPSGRMTARIMGAVARQESEHKGERIRRARQQAAEAGKAHGSLGFGYRKTATGSWKIVPGEAGVIREIAQRVLAGDTLGSVARDLNARHIPTPGRGKQGWRTANIRALVVAGRYAGWREYSPGQHGQRGRGRGFGPLIAQGDWPPILDKATTEQLRVLFSDPARRPTRVTDHLLSGILRCGKCAAPMTGQWNSGHPRYACIAQPGLDRCGGTSITSVPVDEVVTGMVLAALASLPTVRKPNVESDAADVVALADANETLEKLMTSRLEGEITEREWAQARKVLLRRIDRLETAVRGSTRSTLRRSLPADPKRLERRWNDMSLGERRTVIRALLENVTVVAGEKGMATAERLRPTWIV